jgi:benzil reductase ((S)-benzoin forming)
MLVYITGTSSGIGEALAHKFLSEGHKVVGMSRKCSIKASNYEHIHIDLSDLKAVSEFDFKSNVFDDVVLINNAGMLGPVKPIGHQVEEDIIHLNNVNVIAPQILTNKFVHKFLPIDKHYQILNISSGAGKNAIDAWSTYCASKAAVDLFSETVAQELHSRNHLNWSIFSIAPGVVDTKMQTEIRSSNPKNFKNHQKFVDLKYNNELTSSTVVAQKYFEIISDSEAYSKVVFSLRDID